MPKGPSTSNIVVLVNYYMTLLDDFTKMTNFGKLKTNRTAATFEVPKDISKTVSPTIRDTNNLEMSK